MTSASGSVRRAIEAGCALFLARGEFAAAELAQARDAFLGWIAIALLIAVLLMLTLVGLSATIVALFWDRFGWYSMAAMTLIYASLAAWLMIRLARSFRHSPGPLAQTLAELSKDRDAVFGPRSTSRKADG